MQNASSGQADVQAIFDSDPDSLWSKMIRKTELKVAASEPADGDHGLRRNFGS